MINVWDVTAQTDHEKYRRRSDVIAVQKNKSFACPYDGKVDTKELEIIEHYQDLALELRKIWNMKVRLYHQ